ncbi:SAM-dependent methyltransferase [Actinomadura macrotermitis]|uniref:S-adenosyl methyltransferase n=1 Tax=Actinomadura macrotermitis TaxID=2585200 RepID=A0A7K0BP47_9ACTN|nr:SAM-dependent methyltransferase [Actinomadura macrotermitis]MQY02968.1 hypothetical protein [Actinomadura macrotermitis]
MSERTGAPPTALDLETPSDARIYDCFLGGKDNYQADRQAAGEILALFPQAARMAKANRWMIARGVRYALAAGIRQIVDIGGGLPTYPSTLDVARDAARDARVVMIDSDPVVAVHYRALTPGGDVEVLEADLVRTGELLAEVGRLIDLRRPTLFVLGSMLHFLPGQVAATAVARLREAIAPGGQLLISHATGTAADAATVDAVEEVYARARVPLYCRSEAEITGLFGDLELIEPGLTDVDLWRAGDGDVRLRGMGLRLIGGLAVRDP